MSLWRYLVQTLSTVAIVVSSAASFNWTIDPLSWRLGGRFDIYFSNDRAFKAHWIRLYPHDGLLMGSSKVRQTDPQAISGPRFFNAAFGLATPEEILEFLNRYAQSERLLVIGFDFWMMNEPKAPGGSMLTDLNTPPFYGHSPREWFAYLTSLESAEQSLGAAIKLTIGAPGFYSPAGNVIVSADSLAAPSNKLRYERNIKLAVDDRFQDFRYSMRRIGVIKAIRDWAVMRRARLLVFLNPLNADEAALLRALPAWSYYDRFRSEMREIFPNLTDFTDDYPEASNYMPNDGFHYRPEVGARMIETVLKRHKEEKP